MVHVTFYRDSRQRLSSVFSSGHVEIAESSSAEYSLVCAAVSAILQAARLGLAEHVGTPLDATQRRGEMTLGWPEASRDDARLIAIVRTAELATEQIARQYPEHVRIERALEPA